MVPILPAIVTGLALLLYVVLTGMVGRARGLYKVHAPATTGNPAFERIYRAHLNTAEQLVLFLPSLWLFSIFVSSRWGAAIGTLWIIGRILYVIAYSADAEKRGPGMIISFFSSITLLIGGLIGAAMALTVG